MIATELHSLVDVLSACIPLGKHAERFIDHRQQNAIDDEAAAASDRSYLLSGRSQVKC